MGLWKILSQTNMSMWKIINCKSFNKKKRKVNGNKEQGFLNLWHLLHGLWC